MTPLEGYPDFIVPATERKFFDYIDSIKHMLAYAKEYLLSLPSEQRPDFIAALNVVLKKWYSEAGWAPFEGMTGPYQSNGIEGGKYFSESGNINGFAREVHLNGKLIERESYWHGEYKFEHL